MAVDISSISDSTDWLATPVPALSSVDAALRCQVCKDFYKTPMLTECCHTFCSTCIRRALSNDGKCPLCRTSQQETRLRNNAALSDLVDAFAAARPAVLDFARNPPVNTHSPVLEPTRPISPKRKLSDSDGPTKRLRTSSRLCKSKGVEKTAVIALEEAGPGQTQDQEWNPPIGTSTHAQTQISTVSILSDSEGLPDDGLAECPVCQVRMKPVFIDRHLDTCLSRSALQTATPSSFDTNTTAGPSTNTLANTLVPTTTKPTKPPKRLPVPNYSMFKDNTLRKKLAELGLTASGSKQTMEKRHREWITIWNANCDSPQPKKKSDLVRELDRWERIQGSSSTFASSRPDARGVGGVGMRDKGASIRDKDFDGPAWSAANALSYKDLIAAARMSTKTTHVQTTREESGTDGHIEGPLTKPFVEDQPRNEEGAQSKDAEGDQHMNEEADRPTEGGTEGTEDSYAKSGKAMDVDVAPAPAVVIDLSDETGAEEQMPQAHPPSLIPLEGLTTVPLRAHDDIT